VPCRCRDELMAEKGEGGNSGDSSIAGDSAQTRVEPLHPQWLSADHSDAPPSIAAEVVDEMKVDVESRVASMRPSPDCSWSPDGFCQGLC
jgi:hypothetical protein